jgi:hypothetical protein
VFGRSSGIRRWKTACPTCCANFALIGASAFHLLTPNELRQRRLLLPTNLHTAEGFVAEYEKRWFVQIRQRFVDRFGQEIRAEH